MRRANGEDVEKPSDLLSIFVLKALKPELYRDTVDHRVVGRVQHEIVIDLVRPSGPEPERIGERTGSAERIESASDGALPEAVEAEDSR